MEKDIYDMYLNGPFDWLNPLDVMTDLLTGGPKGPWAQKAHAEKIYEISLQYPNLTVQDVDEIVARQKNCAVFDGCLKSIDLSESDLAQVIIKEQTAAQDRR